MCRKQREDSLCHWKGKVSGHKREEGGGTFLDLRLLSVGLRWKPRAQFFKGYCLGEQF